jgi:predicted HAD superfamily Cof-like phosphohydrolase
MKIFRAYKNKILPFLSKKATQIPTLEQKQDELIQLLYGQVVDLSMMSKIELGDDVIQKWKQLNQEIQEMKSKSNYVPFISEVEEFNTIMGKPNNYTPVIPDEKEWMFVYNFILEELEEYKHACETGDIVEVLDALCDITYVSLGNGAMLHGLKDKVWPAYKEVQASNLSKACTSEEEAQATVRVRSEEQKTPCHYEKIGEYYIVYRSSDRKVMKNINYFRPDLSQFLK